MLVAIPEAPETCSSSSSASNALPSESANVKRENEAPMPTNSVPIFLKKNGATEMRNETENPSGGVSNNVFLRRENSSELPINTNGMIGDFPMMDAIQFHDRTFQQELLQVQLKLKQEQELQHHMLLQRYEAQRQQLAQAHEKQLQQRMKEFWEAKRRQEEENEKLEALKKKDKNEQSAVASSEVKQKLQGFLLNKKQREAAAGAGGVNVVGSSSGASIVTSSTTSFGSHPYKRPVAFAKYEDDFPLRKTASEPNLLKMRLKQRVLERRSSPLVRRKDRFIKRRSNLAMDGSGSAGSTPDSGPNSPPINLTGVTPASGSGGGTPQHEDVVAGNGASSYSNTGACDLTLYSSPSLPNISLGKPIPTNDCKLPVVSETVGPSPPLNTNGIPMVPLPFPADLEALYQPGNIMALASYQAHAARAAQMAAAAQAAASEMNDSSGGGRAGPHGSGKTIARPLGRTQSAPLPLGHPMLMMNNAALMLSNNPNSGTLGPVTPNSRTHSTSSNGGSNNPTHQLVRQHIRQTVLTRAGSRGQVIGSSLSRGVSVEEASENETGGNEVEFIGATNKMAGKSENPPTSTINIPNSVSAIPPRLQIQQPQMHSAGNILQQHHHLIRPLSRALSSPLVALGPTSPQESSGPMQSSHSGASAHYPVMTNNPNATGVAYDNLMLKHQCVCGDNSQHPEHPGRLQSIWARLQETGLLNHCERVRTRKATLEEIQSCHSEAHTLLFGTNPLSRQRMELSRFPESSLPIKSLVRLPCNGIGVDSDTAWNELHTPSAAKMAAGCVIDLAYRVASGDLKNGFAIVRPPGHHAEPIQAMGFCFFNSVAIAAKQLKARLNLEKILILDWDIHHGNGTQQLFYDDPHVLYISIHRHDDGNFFPGTGGPTECGVEDGMGFNVNIPWKGNLNPPMGDAEYLAAFRSIVIPIAQDFQPEIIIVSCGFDAATGHPAPLGGYCVSPACFGWMTQQLKLMANGKVVLALEGGYDLTSICDSSEECVRALLSEHSTPISEEELCRPPCPPAVDTLLRTIAIQTPHWPCIKKFIPFATCSAVEASTMKLEVSKLSTLRERVESETINAMASLSMQHAGSISNLSNSNNRSTCSPASGSQLQSNNHKSDDDPSSPQNLVRRRNSDMNVGEDVSSTVRETSEEPMDQDEPTK